MRPAATTPSGWPKHRPPRSALIRWITGLALVIAMFLATIPLDGPASAIVRGQTVNPAPSWMAAVLRSTPFGIWDDLDCSGSVIAPRYVLTAGHCVIEPRYVPSEDPFVPIDPKATEELIPTPVVGTSRLRVATGATNANKASERRRIASIRVHPDYQQRVFYGQNEDGTPKAIRCAGEFFRKRCRKVIGVREVRDVAVLELVDALPSRYQPITLGTAVDGPAVAYGYGRTDNNKSDGMLRRTKDNAYQVERCQDRDDVLCARTSDSYVDSGDSGGPWLQERNGVPVQVGISSAGTPQTHKPVNVGAVAPWINKVAGLRGGGSSKMLIFGNGDFSDVDPLTNLGTILGAAGYQVTTSSELPADLNGYGAIWHIGTAPLDAASADRLVTFAQSGKGLYLTGERPCCEELNMSVAGIVNRLVVTVGGVGIGGLGDPPLADGPLPVNSAATDRVASRPFTLTTWQPSAPGGMSNVGAEQMFAYVEDNAGNRTPVAAVWGADRVIGGGRLAVLMDINWLESLYWDPASAYKVAQNLELFLAGLPNPPAPPVTAPEATVALRRQQEAATLATPGDGYERRVGSTTGAP